MSPVPAYACPVSDIFRVAFVPGVAPDKWVRRWRERFPDHPLEVALVPDADQRSTLETGAAAVCFLRLPVDRDGLHVIPLYVERSVVVVSTEDDLTLHEELSVADLAGHQLVTDPAELPAWSEIATVERLPYPRMAARDAVEVVAGGAGTVAMLPMSVARLHHRKDVVARPLTDGPEHPVGIAWRRDDEDPRIEEFVGIVRGRTANSSRGNETAPAKKEPAKKAPVKKATPQKATAGKAIAKKPASRRPVTRKGKASRRGRR